MKFKKIFSLALVVITLTLTQTASAQTGFLSVENSSNISPLALKSTFSRSHTQQRFSKQVKYESPLFYNPKRDPKRLLINTGLYVGAAIVSFAVIWSLPEDISNWDKAKMKEEGLGKKWKENVQAGPIWDEDDWVLNYVMHPWFGGVYYMSARGSGFKAWESFAYSAVMSTLFWEYGVEAFAEIPSWQDVIVTPVLGSIVGEGFFIAKKRIIRNDTKLLNSRFLGRFTIFLMDPFNAMINGMGYKTKHKVSATSSLTPIYDPASRSTLLGMQVRLQF